MTKAKEKKKSSTPSKRWEAYKDGKKIKKECPKCGKGIFLAQHKNPDRYYCGKCAYVEFIQNNQ